MPSGDALLVPRLSPGQAAHHEAPPSNRALVSATLASASHWDYDSAASAPEVALPLYEIELKRFSYEIPNWGERGRHIMGTYKLTLEGEEGDDEGVWWISQDAGYVRQRAGAWRNVNFRGERSIFCEAERMPNGLAILLLDAPNPKQIISIDDILHFPLFVGETGFGKLQSDDIAWRVLSRSF